MIPEQTLVQFPEFSDSGTKVKPGDAKYSAGFQEADVLPAEWLNWFLNKASDGISVINSGVASMEKELNNIVTETGDTPAEGTNNQVVTSIKKLRDAITGALSNLSTTAKTSLVAAINEVDGDVGALTSLSTTTKTSLVAALNEVVTNVGTLSSLTTTAKTSLVAAINELVTNIGTLSTLTTTEKTSIVGAVNEVKGGLDGIRFIPQASVSGTTISVSIPGMKAADIITGTTISVYFTSAVSYSTSGTTFSLQVKDGDNTEIKAAAAIYEGTAVWSGCPVRSTATGSTFSYYYVAAYQTLQFRWSGSYWYIVNESPYLKYNYDGSSTTAVSYASYNFGNYYKVRAYSDGTFKQYSYMYKFETSGGSPTGGDPTVGLKILPTTWYNYSIQDATYQLSSANTNTAGTNSGWGVGTAQFPGVYSNTFYSMTTQGFKSKRLFWNGTTSAYDTTNAKAYIINGVWK